jgi:hypothetical protein
MRKENFEDAIESMDTVTGEGTAKRYRIKTLKTRSCTLAAHGGEKTTSDGLAIEGE